MTREIVLNGKLGGVALVDDEDYAMLIARGSWRQGPGGYAECTPRINGKVVTLRMHTLVCRAAEGQQVDHKNRNKLDNRRDNLHSVTSSENKWNQDRTRQLNKHGFAGVYWRARSLRWVAKISINGHIRNLGTFDTAEAAGAAYEAARQWRNETGTIPDETIQRQHGGQKATPPAPCSNCGTMTTHGHMGRCKACYHYQWRHGRERPIGPPRLPKLPADKFDEIRQRCAQGEKQSDVARDYGVSQTAISQIITGLRS